MNLVVVVRRLNLSRVALVCNIQTGDHPRLERKTVHRAVAICGTFIAAISRDIYIFSCFLFLAMQPMHMIFDHALFFLCYSGYFFWFSMQPFLMLFGHVAFHIRNTRRRQLACQRHTQRTHVSCMRLLSSYVYCRASIV